MARVRIHLGGTSLFDARLVSLPNCDNAFELRQMHCFFAP